MYKQEYHCRVFNTRFAGKEAFTATTAQGYKAGGLLSVKYDAHRIAWLLATGEWPRDQIDHIDGDRANNRFVNLREANHAINNRNARMRTNNTSGVCGVNWDSAKGKWRATININGRKKELGRFVDISDAINARLSANQRHGYTERHGER